MVKKHQALCLPPKLPQISAEVDREGGTTGGFWSCSPSLQCLGETGRAVGRARKQRSWLPWAAGPCRHASCPPSGERPQREESHGNYGIGVFPLVKSDLPKTGAVGPPGCGQWESSWGGGRGGLEPLAGVPLEGDREEGTLVFRSDPASLRCDERTRGEGVLASLG